MEVSPTLEFVASYNSITEIQRAFQLGFIVGGTKTYNVAITLITTLQHHR